ncbi:MAG: Thiamine precursor transporter HmpT [Anaerolineales bacterium]|nr:Thiamine precursor transporter HmpT [Anaerolineales bacterium]
MLKEHLTLDARTIALIAIMTAVTIVFTLGVRVPFAPTRGYFTLADVGVYFAAFAFGPAVGFIVGGLGTGLADILGGYAHFAIWSFLIHGVQGLVAGYLAYQRGRAGMVAGWLAGAVVMVGGYFAVEYVLFGPGPAAGEATTINLPQVLIGGLIAIGLLIAVRRAYPQIDTLTQPRTWREG